MRSEELCQWEIRITPLEIELATFRLVKLCIHLVVCLTTCPQPLPERVLHRMRSSVSSLNFQYLPVFLGESSSCLRLLPRLPVAILLSICHSVTCFRRQFLKIWPVQSIYSRNYFSMSLNTVVLCDWRPYTFLDQSQHSERTCCPPLQGMGPCGKWICGHETWDCSHRQLVEMC